MPVNLCVAGTRSFLEGPFTDTNRVTTVDAALAEEGINASDVACVLDGGAAGGDRCGRVWAVAHDVPGNRFEPDWDAHGKAAGPKRNAEMAAAADVLLAFWDGSSAGTQDMIERCQQAPDVDVHVVRYDHDEAVIDPEAAPPFSE
ncbi:hypothetical protein RYH80_18830 [Halobaculum sp. MBLA0147]|uniref:hypothetical protein n=1 Tax=Halobaculum sp. MBLA0147 TaxID=3079934 RepID=UPI00352598E6